MRRRGAVGVVPFLFIVLAYIRSAALRRGARGLAPVILVMLPVLGSDRRGHGGVAMPIMLVQGLVPRQPEVCPEASPIAASNEQPVLRERSKCWGMPGEGEARL